MTTTEHPRGWRTITHRLTIEQRLIAAGIEFSEDADIVATEEHVFFEVGSPRHPSLVLFIAVYANSESDADARLGMPETTADIRFRSDGEPVGIASFAFVGTAFATADLVVMLARHWRDTGAL